MTDRSLGIVFLFISALYIYFASQTELSFISDPFGPKKFPYLIGIILLVTSIFMIIKPQVQVIWPNSKKIMEIILMIFIFILYSQLLPTLGFIICTFFASTLITWRLGTPFTKSIIFGLSLSLSMYLLFSVVLGLSLARGLFGF